MISYENVKKLIVRYGYDDEENETKDIDISYVLKSDIDMEFPLLALYEILKQIRENNKLGMPNEIIMTVNVLLRLSCFQIPQKDLI